MRARATVHVTLYCRGYENGIFEWWITFVDPDGKSQLFDEGAGLSFEQAKPEIGSALAQAVNTMGAASTVELHLES